MSSALGLFSLVSSAWAALLQGQMPEPEIIKTLISKLLGYGILAGSLGVKVPQVKNILQNKSAEGLSALSAELELIGLAIHASYGYLKGLAFNTYGEVVIVGVQSAFILGLIYHYSKASSFRRLFMSSACIGLLSVVVSGRVPMPYVELVFQANMFIFMASRIPQIVKNFMEKSTGQLSVITIAINCAGGAVRIFTTLTENGGTAMLRQYISGLVLYGIIFLQILFYGNSSSKSKEVATKEEGKKQK